MRIVELMEQYPKGLISDEAEDLLALPHQSCSARFSEMKSEGVLILTGEKRKTKYDSDANVHALPRFKKK